MMSDILADDDGEGLAAEFEAAADNPESFDFSFAEQRKATGFANFGFDPDKAAAMRAADPSNKVDEEYPHGIDGFDPDEDDDDDWDDDDDTDTEW